ncbi:hypothetical protein [Novipirellula caenicola]|uniref:PGG domain-containing protein n=1 Tax=Novipirellula caenicola TaxID=1536901 RepID=A0ABP9VUU2_9BACT
MRATIFVGGTDLALNGTGNAHDALVTGGNTAIDIGLRVQRKQMANDPGMLKRLKHDLITACVIGTVIAVSIASAAIVLGHVGDTEARRLLEAIIPTSRLFCSSLLTVSATILALMLTMIGLGNNADRNLADAHYHRIIKIALYDAILFCAAAIMFVLHCVPVYESDSLPGWWYPTIYYGVLIASSLLAGGAVAIVSLLYLAVKDVVQIVALGQTDHRYAACQTDEDDASSTTDHA